MAKYRQTEGRRHIAGDGGYRWDPVDGAYVLDMPGLGTYTLEKRRRNPKDDTHTTGWYLYGDAAGSFFGEFCGTRILDAADEAGALIDREQRAAAPNELDDENSWDEPRAELTPDEVYGLRPGRVIEARTVAGARCRLRLAATPEPAGEGRAIVETEASARHEVRVDSVALLGVMPRKGDTIHAKARTYTTPRSVAELPKGTRVRCAGGEHEGRFGTVNGADVGHVDDPGHRNHGRRYVGVTWDAVDGDMGCNRRSRPFIDELRIVGTSQTMRRKLDRDSWLGDRGQLVVSDGRGLDMVLTSSVVILAAPSTGRTDEQRIARAVQLAMPDLDFHTNETSTSAIRVYANKLEGEQRDDEDVLARNDDIAEAIRLAGFYVARRGVGQAVYASVERSGHAHGNGLCEVETHEGEPAPWIAVLTGGNPLEAPYVCRDCVRRHVEGERAPEPAGLPQGGDPRTTELRRAGAALRRWIADERTDGPAAFAPNAVVRFGPELAAQLESMPAAEAGQSLVEAARMINDVEAGWPSTN